MSVIPSLRNAIYLREAVNTTRPRAEVFRFLTHELSANYRALSPAHDRFDILGGGPLVRGSVIDCRERASNQEIHHRYVVEQLVPDELIYYVSSPSHSFVHLPNRIIEGRSNTYVSYALRTLESGHTELFMTIAIEFESLWQMLVARVLGRAYSVWKAHQVEELNNLVTLLDADPGHAVKPPGGGGDVSLSPAHPASAAVRGGQPGPAHPTQRGG